MTQPPEDGPDRADDSTDSGATAQPLEVVRGLLTVHTQRLLGDTIGLDDEQWRSACRLPGWSRGHLATHLARHADAVVGLAEGAVADELRPMYASDAARDGDIDAGAGRSGVELQVDLDSSAGRLQQALDAVATADAWGRTVELRGGGQAPARLLPLMRLGEVVIHHVDLDVGYELAEVPPLTASWVLEWCAFRVGLRGGDSYPALRLEPDDADSSSVGPVSVGAAGEPRTVTGPAAALLGWLTQRNGPEQLRGADGLDLPSFG